MIAGGASDVDKLVNEGKIMELIESGQIAKYDYDLFVIGGGSGGLSCSKVSTKSLDLLKLSRSCLKSEPAWDLEFTAV